jgi:hypothetical protein
VEESPIRNFSRSLTACRFVGLIILARTSSLAGQIPARLFSLSEQFRIDGTAQQLSTITFVLIERQGAVIIGQRDDFLLRYFDTKGNPTGTFGRAGEGPGEFRYLMRAGWRGDTIWAFDNALRRITLIGPARTVGKTMPAPISFRLTGVAGIATTPASGLTTAAVLPHGELLQLGVGQEADQKYLGLLARTDSSGNHARLIAIPSRQREQSCVVPASGRRFDLPYDSCFVPGFAVAPDGSRVVTFTTPANGSPDRAFRLVAILASGDTVLDRVVAVPPQPLDIARYRRVIDTAFAQMRNNSPLLEAALRAQIPTPKNYPAASAVLAAGDGTIWIRRRLQNAQRWLGFDARGNYFGEFELPLGQHPAAISRTELYLVERDADGVESLVKYHVGR